MKSPFGSVYEERKVLITGHTGFKGSWLALWLAEMGAEVLGYALEPPTFPNHFDLLELPMTSVIGDIRDLRKLSETFQLQRPEIVFHLAAQPLVRYSYKEPRETFETNIMGTVNVFEVSRATSSVKAIVNVTSDKCYENREWVWGYRENDPMGGHDPYSASKGCAELVTSAYRNSFFHPDQYGKIHNMLIASARAGNVIGGGDWGEDRLIPDIMRSVTRGEKAVIRNATAVRPWQHVLEPLGGYLQLGQKLLEGETSFAGAWNLGPDNEGTMTVQEVVELTKRCWEVIDHEIGQHTDNLREAKLLKLDCSKAHTHLRWKRVWNTQTTFELTIEWYRQYYEKKSIVSLSHLAKYLEDARNNQVEWAL